MFWKEHRDYEQEFRTRVREFVWNGDDKAIAKLYAELTARQMIASKLPQATREQMRYALEDALLEPNRNIRRNVFRNRSSLR